jgi:hypothetical protein
VEELSRVDFYPPVIPMSASAAYLKRPETMAKGTAVNTQTAKKDFGPKGGDVLSLGTTRARNGEISVH